MFEESVRTFGAGLGEHKELAAGNGHPMQAIAQKGSAHVRNLHVP